MYDNIRGAVQGGLLPCWKEHFTPTVCVNGFFFARGYPLACL